MPNFSGVWTLQEQFEAITEGNWTGITSIELYAWGHGAGGKVGDNTVITKSSPVQIGTDITWTSDREKMGAGRNHNMMIDNSNQLFVLGGYAFHGNLGLNDRNYRSSPTQVGALTNWNQVSAGQFFTHSVKTDGTLWGWGQNDYGQIGDNTRTNRSSPVQIGALTNWALVQSGYKACFAITTGGELYAWGLNTHGDAGLNDNVRRSSPVQVGALTNWSQVSGNLAGSTPVKGAIKTDGTIWSWGHGANYNSLGHNDMVSRSSPTQIGALTTWSQVIAEDLSFHAIKTDGTLWGWGYEGRGQVGDNTAVRRSSPVQIGSDTTWAALPLSGGPSAPLAISSYTTGMS